MCIRDSLYSASGFDGQPVEKVIEHFQSEVERLRKLHPEATEILYDYGYDDSYELVVWGLENDEQYNSRLVEEQTKAEKERARDLATLKRLQAKYPDVTIEC